MQVHDQVLGLGVPVADLALVAVRVPRHLLRLVLVLPASEVLLSHCGFLYQGSNQGGFMGVPFLNLVVGLRTHTH